MKSTALALGTTADHVTETFRRDTGIGVKDFICRVRIEIASYLLAETRDKQHVIAERVGLYDAAHLSHLFQRYLGHCPGGAGTQQP